MKGAFFAVVAVVGSSFLLGCQRPHLPESPLPAVLSDREALVLAEQYLADGTDTPRELKRMEATGQGYLLAYESPFDPGLVPPKETRLVTVHHDGVVRELIFDEGR